MASTMGAYNPLRYRGYVWDTDTGLFYLQSRYYSPKMGRFINADTVFDIDAGLQGYNIFAYCGNDPINRIDITGASSVDIADGEKGDEPFAAEGSGSNGKAPSAPPNTGGTYEYRTFKNQQLLEEHYTRHNPEMGYKYRSTKEYVLGANEVIKNGEYIPELNAYVRFYNYWGGSNYLFVGMTRDGHFITTFHIKSAHKIFE